MAHAASARIVIAEHWSILRRGVIGVLQGRYAVVGGFADVSELAPLLQQRDVEVAVIGDRPGVDLAAVVARLRAERSTVQLVVLCDHIDAGSLRAVLQAGAGAVLSKRVEDDALLDAIARVLDGERVIDQPFLPLLIGAEDLEPASGRPTPSLLTRREHDVLLALASGATNREIADALVMSESTVKSHLRRLYSKLEVSGRHGAVGRAMELQLLA